MLSNTLSNNQIMQEEGCDLSQKGAPKIRVVIRKRPVNKKELQRSDADIIDVRGTQTVVVREMKTKVDLTKFIEEHTFNFDHAFEEKSTNEQIYKICVKPLVESAFQRAKVTCFAYGQTGSGKTYTMLGDVVNRVPGMYLLASDDIFRYLEKREYSHITIWLSFYEIYCGKLFDLLNDRQLLYAREDAKQNINIVGLQEKRVTSVQSLMQIIDYGSSVRVTGQNSANNDSSRSHAILQITLKEGNNIHGKMSFIDLAGSERGADVVESNKQTRMDGAEINKSLLALKECIRALDQNKNYTPFRGSKLTLVLKDSFTGNCKTVMIGNISPCSSNSENTLNTLRYADRVKELKKPSTNDLNQQVSDLDMLARELMLPRQNKNITRINCLNENNQYQDLSPSNQQFYPPQQNQNNQPNFSSGLNLNSTNFPPNNTNINNNCSGVYNNNIQNQNKQPLATVVVKKDIIKRASQPNPSTSNLFFNNNQNEMTNDLFGDHTLQYQQTNQSKMSQHQPNGDVQQKSPLKNSSQMNYQNTQNHLQITQKPQLITSINQNAGKRSNQSLGQLNGAQLNQYLDNNTSNQLTANFDQMKNWSAKNEEDLQVISNKHEQLVGQILQEEEEVISSHRTHIDDMVELIKQEMILLHEVDQSGSDVDEYVESLNVILNHKADIIQMLRNKLSSFKDHLKQEQVLSKKYYEQRAQILDVFDLNQGTHNNDDMQLLEDLPSFNGNEMQPEKQPPKLQQYI